MLLCAEHFENVMECSASSASAHLVCLRVDFSLALAVRLLMLQVEEIQSSCNGGSVCGCVNIRDAFVYLQLW